MMTMGTEGIEEFIVGTLNRGGSGTGVSHYTTAAKCGKKAQLDQTFSIRGENFKADVGTVFHALRELSDRRVPVGSRLEVSDVGLAPTVAEAYRLHQFYMEHYRAELDMIEVIDVELKLEGPEVDEAAGVSPFSMRIDRVVRINDNLINLWRKLRPEIAAEVESGLYLWDYKTSGQKDSGAQLKSALNPQFNIYPMVYNIIKPHGEECRGMIGDYIVRHQKLGANSVHSTFNPPPSEEDAAGWRRWLAWAKTQFEAGVPNRGTECTNFGICGYYASGLCSR